MIERPTDDGKSSEEIFIQHLENDQFFQAQALICVVVDGLAEKTDSEREEIRYFLTVLLWIGRVEAELMTLEEFQRKIPDGHYFPDELEQRYQRLFQLGSEKQERKREDSLARKQRREQEEKRRAALILEGKQLWPACHELIEAITDDREPPTLPFSAGVSEQLTTVVRDWFREGLWNKGKPPVKLVGNLIAVIGALLDHGIDSEMSIDDLMQRTGLSREQIQKVTNPNHTGNLLKNTPWKICTNKSTYTLSLR